MSYLKFINGLIQKVVIIYKQFYQLNHRRFYLVFLFMKPIEYQYYYFIITYYNYLHMRCYFFNLILHFFH